MNNDLELEIIKVLKSLKNSKILDIGSGDFRHNIPNFNKNNNKYFPIDVKNSGHWSNNKDKLNHKNLVKFYDGINIPYKSNCFDFIIFTETLEHVESPHKLKKDIFRVLKKGGRILITIPFLFAEHEMPYDFRRYTINGLTKFFNEKNKYKIIKKIKIYKGTASLERLISSELTKTKKIDNYVVDRFIRYSLKIIFRLIKLFYSFKNSYGGALVLLKKK